MPVSLSASVIICAYTERRWDMLRAAVESVRSQTHAPQEIIVVVDHAPALFQSARRELAGVVVIENSSTRGLSGARNSGVQVARGDIVAFLDDDATADAGWLSGLLRWYSDPDTAGSGGRIVPQWETERPSWWPVEFDWVVGCTYRGMPERSSEVRNLIGCNMSFRRSLLLELSGFRAEVGRVGTLPVGCEETELCIRVQQLRPGSRLIYDPLSVVRHRVPAARANWSYFARRCFAEGRSKAVVSRLVGARAGLATERRYVARTLPKAALAGVADATARRDRWGLARAGVVGAGLVLTGAGYADGIVRGRPRAPRYPGNRESVVPA